MTDPASLPSKHSGKLALGLIRFRELGILLMVLLVAGVAALVEPRFATLFTLRNILLWIPILVVVGMGEMMVIVTRGIDVSVGSILGLSAMLVGMLFVRFPDTNIYLATLLAVGIGGCLGLCNGVVIALTKVPPIVTTLGTLSIYRGATFIVSDGRQIDNQNIPQALIGWSREGLFGMNYIPYVVLVPLAVAGLTYGFLRYTRTGRNIYAIGGNPEAAFLRGIPYRRTLLIVYTLSGAAAGMAGMLYASRFGFINPGKTGVGIELTVIAAVVIGGTNIFGGSGTVPGVVLGCVLLGTINVALATLGIEGSWQLAVYGLIILIAIILDHILRQRLESS